MSTIQPVLGPSTESAVLPAVLNLESLEVGALPVVSHFLNRLNLTELFAQHLPVLPGRAPTVPSGTVLSLLITNFLLARQPLYAIPDWTRRRVPDFFGLAQPQLDLLVDDRLGRALDHLFRADRASLLTAVIVGAVKAFSIRLEEFHQDTTTITFFGDYAEQAPLEQAKRPARLTRGYNKDHRPDLKQLLYGRTVTSDGAVPVHCKVYDGNTSDEKVHISTWESLRQLVGHADFLYVADCKLCTRENMQYIDSRHGRFLTLMPKTRKEDGQFKEKLKAKTVVWEEVYKEDNPRGKDKPPVVYRGWECDQGSVEGYRLLWYHSSLKAKHDEEARNKRLSKASGRLKTLGEKEHQTPGEALAGARKIIEEEEVQGLILVTTKGKMEEVFKQKGAGRPGPKTKYEREEKWTWRIEFSTDREAVAKESCCDGVFPLMSNDKKLSVKEALQKYKYQPFAEKRHEQLKSIYGVVPMWLKSPSRIEALLFLYHIVELTQALIERELRRQMAQQEIDSLPLYPEGRRTEAPTANLVFSALENIRRHRLLDERGHELRRFHDPLPEVARRVLDLLDINLDHYGAF